MTLADTSSPVENCPFRAYVASGKPAVRSRLQAGAAFMPVAKHNMQTARENYALTCMAAESCHMRP